MSLVFENQALSSTEKLIMLALADHANDEGKSVYPSQITISRKTGLARGTVNRHIQNLIDNEYLWDKGYRLDRSNVLELEINVKRLVENVGVTESDTLDMGEGVTEDDRGVSRRVTGGVTEDDTNHQLTINFNHYIKNVDPDLFKACQSIYERKKGALVTDGQSFALMISNFEAQGVTADDYAAAIDAMDSDKRYRGSKPTSYEKWALGIADKRKNPAKYSSDKRNRQSAEKLDPNNYAKAWVK
jgi:DNA-binding MarR family transcriptional regulator